MLQEPGLRRSSAQTDSEFDTWQWNWSVPLMCTAAGFVLSLNSFTDSDQCWSDPQQDIYSTQLSFWHWLYCPAKKEKKKKNKPYVQVLVDPNLFFSAFCQWMYHLIISYMVQKKQQKEEMFLFLFFLQRLILCHCTFLIRKHTPLW